MSDNGCPVIDTHMPQGLQLSLEVHAEHTTWRAFITTVDVEVLEVDLRAQYGETDSFMRDALCAELNRLFGPRPDLIYGDARSFDPLIGCWLNSYIGDLN